jgi:hypothetical protein
VDFYNIWSQCRSTCTSLYASMLCIPDSTTNSWIANQIGHSWIGYADNSWVEGCSSSYKNGYSSSVFNGKCASFNYGSWVAYSCDSVYSPVYARCACQYHLGPSMSPTYTPTSPTINPSTSEPSSTRLPSLKIVSSFVPSRVPTAISTIAPSYKPPTIVPTVGCQQGWAYYNNKCYYFSFGNYYSWSECQSKCISVSATMLCIPDSTTNSWIANRLNSSNLYFSWIGYSDLPNKDRNYKWVSGCSSSYINSTFYYRSNDCAFITYVGVWSSSYDSGNSLITHSIVVLDKKISSGNYYHF